MNFNVRSVGGKYQEVTVEDTHTGLIDKEESILLAQKLITAAEDLLHCVGLTDHSYGCGVISKDLTNHL